MILRRVNKTAVIDIEYEEVCKIKGNIGKAIELIKKFIDVSQRADVESDLSLIYDLFSKILGEINGW